MAEVPLATTDWQDHNSNKNPKVKSLLDIFPPVEDGETPVIRISYPVRFVWVCANGHDHRFRLTAWLCRLLKGVK